MTAKDIVLNLQKLFDETVSPGRAFDALFAMRQARVTWEDAYRAVTTNGKARRTVDGLDETDVSESRQPPKEWECPKCGMSRSHEDHCENPACADYMRNRPKTFLNPKPCFGPYKGKTLTEIAAINPAYLANMAQHNVSVFWREQAKMAQLYAESNAPISHDPGDTGFFGQ